MRPRTIRWFEVRQRWSVLWSPRAGRIEELSARSCNVGNALLQIKYMWTEALVWITGLFSFVSGIALWIHVATSIHRQEITCMSQTGAVAKCMYPRVYFRKGLFFETECAFDLVRSLNCSGGRLVDMNGSFTVALPEVPEIYAQMVLLTDIDVSGNNALSRVPKSWQVLPGLRRLNASFCHALRSWPFALCEVPSSLDSSLDSGGGIDVRGTPVSHSLNWSTQLLWNKTIRPAMPAVSVACLSAFSSLCSPWICRGTP